MTVQRSTWVVVSTAILLFVGCKALRSGDPASATPAPESTATAAAAETATAAPKAAPTTKAATLEETVNKGLEYLINQQNPDGGWGQGGGWRNRTTGGGRVQEGGKGYAKQTDVGSTAMATLALIRSGSTPSSGEYAAQVGRGISFVCASVEASDEDSLYVTDVRGTQIQSKIGKYVDTFLSALILTEAKGKMADDKANKRIEACLNKTIAKIEKNQKADGTFADNRGWASVLSQGLSTKSLNRARQLGVDVSDETLKRVQKQVTDSYDIEAKSFHRSRTFKPWTLLAQADTKKKKAGAKAGDAKSSDAKRGGSNAGVGIYGNSANLAGMAETVRTNEAIEKKANAILANPKASKTEKAKARKDIQRAAQAREYYFSARDVVAGQLENPRFIAGFGSAGGEEYLSYMNISETLAADGGEVWTKWNAAMVKALSSVQNADGSWSGHHCITGRTFVTSAALLTLMADRAPVAVSSK